MEHRTFRRDGLDFHYLAAGAGRPLVLLHGGGSRASHFADLMARLAGRLRVYAFDLRGFGDTGCAAGEVITHQLWAEDVGAVLDHLGLERAWLLGWSLGTTVALNFAAQHSERVEGLVLLGAPHPDKPVNRDFLRRRAAMFRESRDPAAVVDGLLDQIAAMFAAGHRPEALETVRREQIAAAPFAAQTTAAYDTRPPLDPILARVRQPVTLLVGSEDRTCDRSGAEAMRQRLRDARLEVIADCGHYYAVEQPEAVAAAVLRAVGA